MLLEHRQTDQGRRLAVASTEAARPSSRAKAQLLDGSGNFIT
jgi:hypothetical protein